MLAGPLFMLQIYDRVLSSRSLPTLMAFVVIITAVTALGSTIKTKFNDVVTGMGGTAGA